jgi:hypothetical protein
VALRCRGRDAPCQTPRVVIADEQAAFHQLADPFVGVTDQLSKHYEVYGRVTKEKNDNLFAGNTASLGFARNF